ncbi:baseplate J/gp47 family protein [Phaeobacter inhibens]|uniref:baseplate assembly protein n=1 Tax=Phaeobacter inhibens TaxID=221822 RepID=UPI0026E21100|nr:baseplate J/gp47 family protein [Phaeobacter inhibens]MDO6756932.1 baseplate J/gp47 family protein [Phaeobacter inhibens]
MAGGFSVIDMSLLPAPDLVQSVDYEAALSAMLSELRARAPAFDALVESDPAFKLVELAAFFQTMTLQQINDAGRAVMPATATGADLDNIAARYGVARQVIDPGNPEALPPVSAVLESDDDFRRRMLVAFEGLTTAGSAGSYIFHALSAHPDIADASVESPAPGEVLVTILTRVADGSASPELQASTLEVLSADDVRPLADMVTVQSAAITPYSIDASLTVLPGPDSEVARSAAQEAAISYAAAQHRLGRDVTLSGIYAALHQPGVQNVTLTSPAADIVIGNDGAAFCTGISVTVGGSGV